MTNNEAIGILALVVETAKGRCFVTDEAISDAYAMAIKALEAQEWVPCKERLPEEDGLYLVTTSKGQVQVHVFNHNGNSEEYWMRCNKAWKPLPEPYMKQERTMEEFMYGQDMGNPEDGSL